MADTNIRRPVSEMQVLWRQGWQDGMAGLPVDAENDADWQRGWQAADGYQAQQAGHPLDRDRHSDWQDGWQAGANTAHTVCPCATTGRSMATDGGRTT